MNDCLHCHLLMATMEWLNQNRPKTPEGAPMVEHGFLIMATVKVLCDVLEAESQPGQDRDEGTEAVVSAFRKAMADRSNRSRFDGAGHSAH